MNHEPTLVWEKEVPSYIVCIAANPDNGFVFGICRTNKPSGTHTEVLDFSVIPEGTYKHFRYNYKYPYRLYVLSWLIVRDRFADRVASHSSTTGLKQSETVNVTEKMEDMEIDE